MPIKSHKTRAFQKSLLVMFSVLVLTGGVSVVSSSTAHAASVSDQCGSKLNAKNKGHVTDKELQTCQSAYNIVTEESSSKAQDYCNSGAISKSSDSFLRDACFIGRDLGDAHVKSSKSSSSVSSSSSGSSTTANDPRDETQNVTTDTSNDGSSSDSDCVSGSCSDPAADPDAKCDKDRCDFIKKYVNPFINLLSISFGLIAAISIILGGIQYSASGGEPQKVTQAKQRISKTIFAIFAYFFLYSFLQFIIPGGIFN